MECPKCKTNVDLPNHSEDHCLRIRWNRICPSLYRDTDPSQLNQTSFNRVMNWKFKWEENGRTYKNSRGLILVGPSGSGKSRMMYELLRRKHMEGARIAVFDCNSFSHECSTQFSDPHDGYEWICGLVKKDIVFFDDIDKCRFTDRVEVELFGLIEKRIANQRPILATTQIFGDELGRKFLETVRGDGLIRRLKEFCGLIPCEKP